MILVLAAVSGTIAVSRIIAVSETIAVSGTMSLGTAQPSDYIASRTCLRNGTGLVADRCCVSLRLFRNPACGKNRNSHHSCYAVEHNIPDIKYPCRQPPLDEFVYAASKPYQQAGIDPHDDFVFD